MIGSFWLWLYAWLYKSGLKLSSSAAADPPFVESIWTPDSAEPKKWDLSQGLRFETFHEIGPRPLRSAVCINVALNQVCSLRYSPFTVLCSSIENTEHYRILQFNPYCYEILNRTKHHIVVYNQPYQLTAICNLFARTLIIFQWFL